MSDIQDIEIEPSGLSTYPAWTDFRLRRVRSGLSQAALARAIGCDPSAVSSWDSGKRRPNKEMRRRLETVLPR